jgi:ribonuclease VapC
VIVDSSALLAIVRAEPDAAAYARTLAEADGALLSVANYVETALVVDAA